MKTNIFKQKYPTFEYGKVGYLYFELDVSPNHLWSLPFSLSEEYDLVGSDVWRLKTSDTQSI